MTTQSKRYLILVAFALLPCGPAALGADLDVTVTEDGGGTCLTVAPGATIDYEITGVLTDTNNEGLAGFVFDVMLTNVGLDSPLDRDSGLTKFGITNPPVPQGFGGTVIAGDLIQVGGAQNTMDPGALVDTDIGHTTAVLATGTLTVPNDQGNYTLLVTNVEGTAIKLGETSAPYAVETVDQGEVSALVLNVNESTPGDPELDDICDGLATHVAGDPVPNGDKKAFISPMLDTVSGDFEVFPLRLSQEGLTLTDSCVKSTGGTPPDVQSLTFEPANGNYVLELSGEIPYKEWTTITLTVENACGEFATVCLQVAHLPGDVSGNGSVTQPDDPFAFTNAFTQDEVLQADIDDDGFVKQPEDILAFANAFNSEENSSLPTKPDCECP